MANRIGIRLEDKNVWERRVPLTPDAVRQLSSEGVEVHVERFRPAGVSRRRLRRGRGDPERRRPGLRDRPRDQGDAARTTSARAGRTSSSPTRSRDSPTTWSMLRRLVDRKCTLLDYELVTDEKGRRLIFFGRYAGIAGMIDTFWTLGRRLEALGHATPFRELKPDPRVRRTWRRRRRRSPPSASAIAAEGLPAVLRPMAVGFTGYGHVSRGAQEVFDLLPHVEVHARSAGRPSSNGGDAPPGDRLAKVVYREEHLVEPVDRVPALRAAALLRPRRGSTGRASGPTSSGSRCSSTASSGPRSTRSWPTPTSCGPSSPARRRRGFSWWATSPATSTGPWPARCGTPSPATRCTSTTRPPGRRTSGFEGPGLAVMAVGNLPCELPREASETFSEALRPVRPGAGPGRSGARPGDGRAARPDPSARSSCGAATSPPSSAT